ncbi:MAG: phytoene desaturase family protein [Actinomycetota bacterium]
MTAYDAIVVGAGHNGLVTAAYLARAGRTVLVLERRDQAGGALATVEIAPGVRAPAVAHTVGRLLRSVIGDLRLEAHGLVLLEPDVRVFAPQPNGRALTFWGDEARTTEELRRRSSHDADAYPGFDRKVRTLASFLSHLNAATPPDLKSPSLADAIAGLKLGKAFRRLGAKQSRELTRALPMAVADFVAESFETDAVRGAVASRAVQYTAMGPWSAGTTAVLLNDSAGNGGGAVGQATFARGGPGALADALAAAARAFGVEVRTGAEVVGITTTDGRATGVALVTGEEISARAVVSGADPKRTLTTLVDPVALGPHLLWRADNIRMPGCAAKVNLALSGLPRFAGADGDDRLRGRIVVAPGIDFLERAFDASKYGRVSDEPYLEATIPTLMDPTLAPEGRHVMSVLVQWAPYHLREGNWHAEREGLGDLVLKSLEANAPGLSDLVIARQVLTPLDLERDYGLTEGHPLHGEPGLDQFFAWRPLLGHARYRFGIKGLYLCGSGAHPGGGVTGAPGANAAREILSDLKRRR